MNTKEELNKAFNDLRFRYEKSWFILTSIIISLLVMLFSGSLQIMRNLRACAA